MSGPDLKHLSSNWKKLQDKLQTGKKQETAQSNGLKRKRITEEKTKASTTNGIKKTRLTSFDSKRRNMGSYISTPSGPKSSDLVKDHDIDPSAITAAYGTTTKSFTDDINGGLHKTHKLGKYVALDCEMVGTGPPPHDDSILARASLVNFHGEQIYDSYVQPPPGVKVEDYRTFVSGIKPGHLKAGYARTFAEVQKDVSDILEGRILVGHALRNDLNALMLSHPKRDLRDTSRYAKFRVESKGRPPALRKLAKSELGLEIQGGEHSSVEDARATMALYKKEKVGFEEENRRKFGVGRREKGKGKGREVTPSVDESEEEDQDDEEDLELLEGEEDGELEDMDTSVVERTDGQPKSKKKKKKKRTKRK